MMSIVTASYKTASLGKMMLEEISSDNAMMMIKLKNSGIILRKLEQCHPCLKWGTSLRVRVVAWEAQRKTPHEYM